MEKRKPSYDLAAFKSLCGDPQALKISLSAQLSAQRLGFDLEGVAAVVRTVERRMFYKSMTSFNDHTAWQDVYHVPVGNLVIYLKFTADVLSTFMVLSFKEK